MNIRDHEEEQFEHERYYLAVEALAQELTSHPTMPNGHLATHTPKEAAQSGIWLGTSSCASKDAHGNAKCRQLTINKHAITLTTHVIKA